MNANARPIRQMLVVSHDFGELANAIHWCTASRHPCEIYLPRRLAAWNGTLSPRFRTYEMLDQLADHVLHARPELLLLFTGYLLEAPSLLPQPSLRNLLDAAAKVSCEVATTDPFLGVWFSDKATVLSNASREQNQLERHFRRVAEQLSAAIHLYLAPAHNLRAPRRDSFFHPSYHALARFAEQHPQGTSSKTWLFVLSQEDYRLQLAHHGVTAFHRHIVAWLTHTVNQGATPVLVAPEACREALSRLAIPKSANLVGFCSIHDFNLRCHSAEFAFYWNTLSNSIVSRLINEQPVFFFDRGHLAHALPELYDLATRHYYAGFEIPRLPMQQLTGRPALAEFHSAVVNKLAPAREQFRAGALPNELIAKWKIELES